MQVGSFVVAVVVWSFRHWQVACGAGRRPERPRRGRNDATLRRVPRRGAWRRVSFSVSFSLIPSLVEGQQYPSCESITLGRSNASKCWPPSGPIRGMDVLNPHATHPSGVRAVRLLTSSPLGTSWPTASQPRSSLLRGRPGLRPAGLAALFFGDVLAYGQPARALHSKILFIYNNRVLIGGNAVKIY